ncbi:MAG TPA: acetate/propionate family kinase [Deltaproteobacteria bacterium]|nr:MAG: hypothetical protein A2Z79_03715 [Deltaproteobacteria bacterium GWA2_55_82]OIJ74491.1 MAG: hypothetical protein A2V21_309615 [Deltaproteobacteria bacterium GWC2_55_46]HBG47149.1 acetate/propionate family kinase [Deltaproteobacteria bacterium]HCY10790.1 acetate/propionate family kinase [Deltaproteobacteria bacterium]
MGKSVLTINSGSSSVKFSLWSGERPLLGGRLERIGLGEGIFTASVPSGTIIDKALLLPDHSTALKALFSWLKERPEGAAISAIGHRVVHGGKITSHRKIDDGLIDVLRGLIPFAAEHLPHEIKAIEAAEKELPGVPQAACFDTSFHTSMHEAARAFALPNELRKEGVERYGFHGLSYEYIMEELGRIDPERAAGRTIIAHLGNGASMCAVKNFKSVDTTMGFTPLGGLVMSTRTGDLDPGVIVYLLKTRGYSADELNEVLNRRSGLFGISGISPDMADLIQEEGRSPRAALAIEIFCRQARKFLAAMSAAISGVDTLVFTAGIGENSPIVRERILNGMGFMGMEVDSAENARGSSVISKGPVTIRVMKTNEELMIARHAARVLGLQD